MPTKPRGKPRRSLGLSPLFSPRLLPHVNTILRMRYCEKVSVESVQKHLATLGVNSHVSALHNFLRRMLTAFPSASADTHQVDLRLLKAVRRRLHLPLQPAQRRDTPKMALPRFACVGTLPAVRPRGPAKSRQEPGEQTGRRPASFEGVPPAATKAHDQTSAVATGQNPTLPQWRIIEKQALAKLPDHVCPYGDLVLDTRTRRPIPEASLVADYGLSEHEAKSLFLSL